MVLSWLSEWIKLSSHNILQNCNLCSTCSQGTKILGKIVLYLIIGISTFTTLQVNQWLEIEHLKNHKKKDNRNALNMADFTCAGYVSHFYENIFFDIGASKIYVCLHNQHSAVYGNTYIYANPVLHNKTDIHNIFYTFANCVNENIDNCKHDRKCT